MKRFLLACLLSVALFSLASLPPARGCAVAKRPEDRIRIVSEQAIIVWDAKNKKEHFIRRANFETSAPYFGFLVPTPTQPDTPVAVPDSTFATLDEWSKAETKVETRVRYHSIFDGLAPVADAAAKGEHGGRGMPMGPEKSVRVLDQVEVAGGKATILKANNAEELRKWLNKHGYDARPELKNWLEWYVEHGWFITAFQFKRGDQPGRGMSPKAVRLSFKADRPFYPYREPEDARKPAAGREMGGQTQRFLRVFFIADGRYSGKLEGAKGDTWPGQAKHAKPLTEEQKPQLTKGINSDEKDAALKAEPAALPGGAWLTVFDDPATPRPGTGEVYFSKDDSQEELARDPIIRYQYEDRFYTSDLVGLGLFAVIVVLGGVYLVWRFGFRKAE
jgi:hypothetical protein